VEKGRHVVSLVSSRHDPPPATAAAATDNAPTAPPAVSASAAPDPVPTTPVAVAPVVAIPGKTAPSTSSGASQTKPGKQQRPRTAPR
jgi:hypothetical protein